MAKTLDFFLVNVFAVKEECNKLLGQAWLHSAKNKWKAGHMLNDLDLWLLKEETLGREWPQFEILIYIFQSARNDLMGTLIMGDICYADSYPHCLSTDVGVSLKVNPKEMANLLAHSEKGLTPFDIPEPLQVQAWLDIAPRLVYPQAIEGSRGQFWIAESPDSAGTVDGPTIIAGTIKRITGIIKRELGINYPWRKHPGTIPRTPKTPKAPETPETPKEKKVTEEPEESQDAMDVDEAKEIQDAMDVDEAEEQTE
jgi:hypothetical protein